MYQVDKFLIKNIKTAQKNNGAKLLATKYSILNEI